MKKIFLLGLLFVALAAASPAQAQKIAYVNSALIMSEMPDVKRADSNLETLRKQLVKKAESKQKELQQSYQSAQERYNRGEMTPKELETTQQNLNVKMEELDKMGRDMESELMTKRQELLKPILDKLQKAIDDVAKEGGYAYVIDSSTGVLLYADEKADITAKVKAKLGM